MINDSLIIKQRQNRFIKTVCETGIVYGLENEEGFATSSAHNFENESGNPTEIICFWSEKALAKSCIKDGWADYKPVEIPLPDFMENWCIGMENDNLIVGTNFDQNMFGYEIPPLKLILEILAELKSNQLNLKLDKFADLDDFKTQIEAL